MKRDTMLMLGGAAFVVGDGFTSIQYIAQSSTPGWATLGWARNHPFAAGALLFVAYKAAWPMIKKGI